MSLPDSPALSIALVFFLVAIVSYSINTITWLIGAWDKSTLLEKVIRLDLSMFFAGQHRNEKQLRWFRVRLLTGNICLLLAILTFFLHYIVQATS
jgi:hypothetical protein